jgi:hypothetical protein
MHAPRRLQQDANTSRDSGWRTISGERRHRADLEPSVHDRMPLQFGDALRSMTSCGRLMRSFSQSKLSRPPPSTQASRRSDRAAPARPRRRGLKQLERRHDVSNYRHACSLAG